MEYLIDLGTFYAPQSTCNKDTFLHIYNKNDTEKSNHRCTEQKTNIRVYQNAYYLKRLMLWFE